MKPAKLRVLAFVLFADITAALHPGMRPLMSVESHGVVLQV